MIVLFNDSLGEFGGSHTLMLRMCRWLRAHDVTVGVLCISDSNTEIVGAMQQIGVSIEVVGNYDLKRLHNSVKKYYTKDVDVKIINLYLGKWLDIECVKGKYNIPVQNILYDIHPETFYKGAGLPLKILRNYAKWEFRRIAKKIYRNSAIISMEETNIKSAREYLIIKNPDDYNPMILRLPMICERKNNYEDIIRKGFESNVIMAAARADFPYKGYLMGLVEDFASLKENFPNIKLCLVVAGHDMSLLKGKINSFANYIKKDIKIHGWLTYSELLSEMQNCKVFVGMGTTILDAALQYKPVVSAAFNTLENKTCGLFSDNPFTLGPIENECHFSLNDLKSILDLDYKQYSEQCKRSFETVFTHYNIDKMMPALLEQMPKTNKTILSMLEIKEHQISLLINKYRYKNKTDKNDFSEVAASNK